MKLPNNYGSVTKLKGNRRRPWVARVSTGTVVNYATHKAYPKQTALGYYETRKDAMQALAEYNANPFNVDQHNMTISELWGIPRKQTGSVTWRRILSYMIHPFRLIRGRILLLIHTKGTSRGSMISRNDTRNMSELISVRVRSGPSRPSSFKRS